MDGYKYADDKQVPITNFFDEYNIEENKRNILTIPARCQSIEVDKNNPMHYFIGDGA